MNNISLRKKLTLNSLLIYFFIWLCTIVLIFYNEYRNFDELMLTGVQESILFISNDLEISLGDSEVENVKMLKEVAKQWERELIELQVWYKGKIIHSTLDAEKFSIPAKTGFVKVSEGSVYHHIFNDKEINLVVPLWDGDTWSLFFAIVSESLLPFILMLPLASIALYLGIDRALRPLMRLTQSIEKRSPNHLDPIAFKQLPVEITPLVTALNQLLVRLGNTIENERNFTANAAHELLTPLTAIKSEAQLCQRQLKKTAPHVSASLTEINQRVDRATHTVEQLVLLSRFDHQSNEQLKFVEKVNIVELLQEEVAEQGNKIEAKELDFDFSTNTESAVLILGNVAALKVLCRNLIDNAVRYTPNNGYIRIYIHSNSAGVIFGIENSGSVMPKLLSTRLIQRFVRGQGEKESGSGLGLSIVQQVALQHRAQLNIDSGPHGLGLKVEISFPANNS
jgi:two-component system sensor histidine kinase QseC